MKFKFGDKVTWEGFKAIIVFVSKNKDNDDGIAQILIEKPLFTPREMRNKLNKTKEGFSNIENCAMLSKLKEGW